MSGDFRPEQQVGGIESTDDPDLARRFGLTDFNRETGLYTAPKAPDAGQRDGVDVQEQRRRDALAEGDAQNDAERELDEKAKRLGGDGQDVTEHDERTPGAPNLAGQVGTPIGEQDKADEDEDAKAEEKAPTKRAGSKASQGK